MLLRSTLEQCTRKSSISKQHKQKPTVFHPQFKTNILQKNNKIKNVQNLCVNRSKELLLSCFSEFCFFLSFCFSCALPFAINWCNVINKTEKQHECSDKLVSIRLQCNRLRRNIAQNGIWKTRKLIVVV